MHDEYMVARVDGDARGRSEDPPIRHRLRPHGIDLEPRRLWRIALRQHRCRCRHQHRSAEQQTTSPHESSIPPSTVPVPPPRSAMYTRSSRSECVILRRQSLIRPGVTISLVVALALAWALAFAAPMFAHDIPSSVTVLAFVKPEGQRLRLVMRVPLESMRDVNFPVTGPGYLDLTRAEPLLADATKLWLADEIQLYENDTRLGALQ